MRALSLHLNFICIWRVFTLLQNQKVILTIDGARRPCRRNSAVCPEMASLRTLAATRARPGASIPQDDRCCSFTSSQVVHSPSLIPCEAVPGRRSGKLTWVDRR